MKLEIEEAYPTTFQEWLRMSNFSGIYHASSIA